MMNQHECRDLVNEELKEFRKGDPKSDFRWGRISGMISFMFLSGGISLEEYNKMNYEVRSIRYGRMEEK